MTDIDQAFRKAYAKRVPHDALDVNDESPAVWIDAQSGRAFRKDDEHSIASPHGKAPSDDVELPVTESRIDKAHVEPQPPNAQAEVAAETMANEAPAPAEVEHTTAPAPDNAEAKAEATPVPAPETAEVKTETKPAPAPEPIAKPEVEETHVAEVPAPAVQPEPIAEPEAIAEPVALEPEQAAELASEGQPDIQPGTTAYDAWTEKLRDFEARPPQPLPAPKIQPPKFSPVWEVDQVALPKISEQLVNDHLSGIGGQLERACREGLQTLAICSQQRGTGRSTVSIAIAQTAAKSGLRVALVDGDVENPTLVEKLQLDMNVDWIDAIAQGFSVEEATVQSIENGFSFVPLLPKTAETLNKVDQYAKVLFDRLKHHYDLIVVDNSPLCYGAFGHAIPITSDVYDAVMMVEDMKSGDTESLEACARRIRAVGIDNIGLIENFSQAAA